MNPRLKKLLDRKAALVRDMRSMLAKAEAEGRDLTAEELAAYQRNESELGAPAEGDKAASGLFADIAREERLAAYERNVAPRVENEGQSPDEALDASDKPKPIKITGVPSKPKFFKLAEDAYLAGRFFLATIKGDAESAKWLKEHGVEMLAAPSSSQNSSGGVLVPDVVAATIIDLKEMYGKFRANCTVAPMTSESLTFPRRLSGVTLTYAAQNTTATPSAVPKFDGVQLIAKELVGLLPYPKSLAEDAIIDFGEYVTRELAYAYAVAEDQAGFIGDGTSTYGGIRGAVTVLNDGNHAGGIVTAAAGNLSFKTLDMADFTSVVGRCPEYAKANAKWFISPAGHADSMMNLAYTAGGNSVVDVTGKIVETFLGYPVVKTHVLNGVLTDEASTIKCLFGDLSLAATLGERRQMSIATSEHLYFAQRQIAVLAVQRFDIVNHDYGDAANAGPVVALKTPAS